MLAVAKCGGPQVEFQPGRIDSTTFDAPKRLPDPNEELASNVSCQTQQRSAPPTVLCLYGICAQSPLAALEWLFLF